MRGTTTRVSRRPRRRLTELQTFPSPSAISSSTLRGWQGIWEQRALKRSDERLSVIDGWPASAVEFKQAAAHSIHLLGVQPGDGVLDLGCGAGAFLQEVLKATPRVRVTGADYSPAMIAVAKARLPLGSWVVHNMAQQTLPFPTGSFDRVVAQGSLHYLPDRRSAENAIREMLRVAKPGGTVMAGWVPHPDLLARRKATRSRNDFKSKFPSKASAIPTPPHSFFPPKELERFARSSACIEAVSEVKLWETAVADVFPSANYSYSLVIRTCAPGRDSTTSSDAMVRVAFLAFLFVGMACVSCAALSFAEPQTTAHLPT